MHLDTFYSFLRLSFKDLSVFRSDFFISIIHLIIYQGIFILFWDALLGKIGVDLGAWDQGSLSLLVLTGLIFSSIRLLFYGFTTMSEKVVTGTIDKYLCRPISPIWALLAEDTKIWASFHSLFTCLLLFIALDLNYHFVFSVKNAFYFMFSVVLGSLTLVLFEGVVSLSSFWFGRTDKIFYLVNSFADFQRYPISLFPSFIQHLLMWVIPIALVSSIPVMFLFGKFESPEILLLAQTILMLTWFFLFIYLWKKALKNYDSVGG
ncbi:ABC-2 family transporter protein [Pseudoalteromonas xiamenensis]|uniref:ABC-2 family transporter protein n=1 Tax=Pseudoalteromonas xiamenensis TaxID=882626 RepID=UPI0027E4A2BE|nr:ABC-2 family transporter protein [Pseudoalteromonas xiamenensis]WMN60568.1 ABC-2 family transporter protein [Pseudoalteromonas xiamenensis]